MMHTHLLESNIWVVPDLLTLEVCRGTDESEELNNCELTSLKRESTLIPHSKVNKVKEAT